MSAKKRLTRLDMSKAVTIDKEGKLTKEEVEAQITLMLAKALIEPLHEVAKASAPGLKVAMIVQFEVVLIPEELGTASRPDSDLVGMEMRTTLVGTRGTDTVESCIQALERRDNVELAQYKAGAGRLH